MNTQHELVAQQFGAVASAYATSSTHSDAAVLADLVSIIDPKGDEVALDIATGAGNMALALAPRVAHMTALDITPAMLEETARRARELGLESFEVVQAPAEGLPFDDGAFDIVTVRTASHHYADITTAVHEMARVTKPGGKVLVVDTYGPEDAGLDEELHRIEKLRDPSHVRNYKASEWRRLLEEAGLRIVFAREHSHALGKRLHFKEWTERMRVSPEDAKTLYGWLAQGSSELRRLLDVQGEGESLSFTLPEITLLAQRA